VNGFIDHLYTPLGITSNYILLSQIRGPPTWRARFPYLYPPGAGWPYYTPRHWVPFSSLPTIRRATVVFDLASTRELSLPICLPYNLFARTESFSNIDSIIVCVLFAAGTC
jgi:hypothetical protein